MLIQDGLRLVRSYDAETLWIEPWGKDGLRVRATVEEAMPRHNWALLDPEPARGVKLQLQDGAGSIENGAIRATVSASGKLCFYNRRGELLLEEFVRDMDQRDFTSHMRLRPREFRGIMGGAYRVAQRFESDPAEKLFGMGQYQHGVFNLKGAHLELIQRNSQVSVPFLMSSKGYAMLWNNPAMGHADLGTNLTEWTAESSNVIDYWITAGDTPAQMEEAYAAVTGTVPMMPEYAMGFWQCKLRYATQRELLSVAREYKRRGLPLSVIVIDFFHWTRHGEWKFDPAAWPDPAGMVRELKAMGVETAVSIWPTVESRSENYREMLEKGFLTRVDAGPRVSMESKNWTIFFDASQAAARKYVWDKAKKSYYDAGIRTFWLDVAEPQYNSGFGLYRYKAGSQLSVGNAYPLWYAQGFYEGLAACGETEILSLSRCAWAGCQRYGTLVWSGDIHSSFRSMRYQVYAGLNMAIAGMPWWTTDIGGFDCGDIRDKGFQELLVRWFQWGTFCPVMRLHGTRLPHKLVEESGVNDYSGADNEVWSFGEDNYPILVKYLFLREAMRPYIRALMAEAHEKGTPAMRPLFYAYPEDPKAWEACDSYLFGPDVLVAPVLEAGATSRDVYLPGSGRWVDLFTGESFEGGQTLTVPAPLARIPVFLKDGKHGEWMDTVR